LLPVQLDPVHMINRHPFPLLTTVDRKPAR